MHYENRVKTFEVCQKAILRFIYFVSHCSIQRDLSGHNGGGGNHTCSYRTEVSEPVID